ncbi:MAG: hypothetical protein PHD29_03745 [bacterium]|nr:hypothetical protein [bacterium]MDD5755808.1 hypothetical protein [bacterium]
MPKIKTLLLTGYIVLSAGLVQATGLTANFGDVLFENLKIGQSFSARDKANLPYVVTNSGTKDIDIVIEVIPPLPKNLKPGYEPIPDPRWITLGKRSGTLKPKGQVLTDFVFNIPNDEKLMGRKFQAVLYPYTYDGILKIGVNSNVYFTIDKEKGPYPIYLNPKDFKDKQSFEVDPQDIYVQDVPLGEKVDLEKKYGLVLKITNSTDLQCKYYMNTIKVKDELSAATLKEGYLDTPDPNILSFDSIELVVNPKETKKMKLYLQFPKDKQYAGKKYMFLVPVVLGYQEVPVIRYVYLYVTTKK